MIYPVYLLLFGVLLTALLGLVASWVDRKVTARVHYRVGPPPLQPLYDLLKLAGKETLVPSGASRTTFLAAPLFGLAAVILASTILWVNALAPDRGFIGDWVVVLYLLLIPPAAVILGGFASHNPLASQGAGREMQVMLAYELPFLVAAVVPVILAGGSIRLGEILAVQAESGAFAWHLSGFLALLVVLLCMQAKLTLVPFDMAEAETELAGGTLIEYSGPALGLYRLGKNMLLFTLPFLVIILFLGGISLSGTGLLWALTKYTVLLVVITVLRNTNPRIRTDQAVRLFWGPLFAIAVAAVVLALAGY
jgi:NADH-quinone oxidoreductase subunit H